MGRLHTQIDDALAEFLVGQPVFFVATAPLAADGHINLSPKGMAGSFVVLDPTTVAYLDVTGSGIETVAHLRENGRIVLMFCAFEGKPRIVRLHGRGRAVRPDDDGFGALAARFPDHPGTRSVVRVEVSRVADSCGFGVPLLRYSDERRGLDKWAEKKGADGIADYWGTTNARSIDGLPGLTDPVS
ncbi:MAG: pyridoxamine 5'-phosphate oxidase family protein [Acidimicrobiia bacterium]